MLEPFVLGMKNGCAISIRALLELLFCRRESVRAICSSPQGQHDILVLLQKSSASSGEVSDGNLTHFSGNANCDLEKGNAP